MELLLKIHCQSRDKFLNHADEIGLWESNLSKYQFLQAHIFAEILHMCYACYVPSHRTIIYHDQKVLFTITPVSINEMLQLQPGLNLTPLLIGELLDLYPKPISTILAQLIQTFIIEERYTPKGPPPYVATIFSPWGWNIVSMISCILGSSTSEYVDKIILAFMSIYTLR